MGITRYKFASIVEKNLVNPVYLPAAQDFRLRESAEASAEELGRRVLSDEYENSCIIPIQNQ